MARLAGRSRGVEGGLPSPLGHPPTRLRSLDWPGWTVPPSVRRACLALWLDWVLGSEDLFLIA